MERDERQFELFVSYHRRDEECVLPLAEALSKREGLRVFLDRWHLVPGEPWPRALERALESCRAAAICVGPGELGPWQQREMNLALERQSRDPEFRVIPVLLPDADPVLGFLRENTWIDLRSGVDDPARVAALAAAVRAETPGENTAARLHAARDSLCPYRGLLHFREEDAPFFLGREPIVDELERTLRAFPLVSVVGASGSGKSSVVRAGLVPRLRRLRDPVWEVLTSRPGDRPLRALATAIVPLLEPTLTERALMEETNALARALAAGNISLRDLGERLLAKQPGTGKILLVIDQLEELYTLTHDELERIRFIDLILDASSRGWLSVVLTLRGDFVSDVLAYRALADRLQGAWVNVGPMTREELRRAMEVPARAVRLSFEPGLVERILDDVGGEPGHLPLLEFVLRQLWEQQRYGQLLHSSYDAMGGLQGAIASRADSVFAALSAHDRDKLQRLFLRLVRPVEGHDYTRRRALGAEVPDGSRDLVLRLANERLVVTSRSPLAAESTVEVSHEALIRHWNQLRLWLERDREFLLWRERMRPLVDSWAKVAQRDDSSLRGVLLGEAEKWQNERLPDLTESELGYIRASVAAERVRRRARRLAFAFAIASLCLFCVALYRNAEEARAAATAAELAKIAAEEAKTAAELAKDEQQRAQLRSNTAALVVLAKESEQDPGRAAAFLRESVESAADRSEAWHVEAVRVSRRALSWSLRGHTDEVTSAEFSSDGRRVVTSSKDQTARVWNAETGETLFALGGHADDVTTAEFSSDGHRLVTASRDHTARVWDLETGKLLASLEGHRAPVTWAEFSRDGHRVFTGSDETVRIWDLERGQLLASLEVQGGLTLARVSPDGRRVLIAPDRGMMRLWDVETAQSVASIAGHTGPVRLAAFSSDGRRILTASGDEAWLWGVAPGRASVSLERHWEKVTAAAFSSDGRRVLTATRDEAVRLWDAETGRRLAVLEGNSEEVTSAAFSPDARRVLTSTWVGTTRLWDAETGTLSASLAENGVELASMEVSPDDRRVLALDEEGAERLWEIRTAETVTSLNAHAKGLISAEFSPDGRRVLTSSWDRTARLWDVETGDVLFVLQAGKDHLMSAAFSADGRRVMAPSELTARLWDAETGRGLGSLEGHADADEMISAEFSPDGRRAITASWDGTARVWDLETLESLVSLDGHSERLSAAKFCPDGRRVLTASWDGTARLWDAQTGQAVISFEGHTGAVTAATSSRDGRRVLTASWDGTGRLWDVESGRTVISLEGHTDAVLSARFSPDGSRVLTSSLDDTARLWDAQSGKLLVSLEGHTGDVISTEFSPDGRRVLTASLDDTARLWDAQSGKLLVSLEGHTGDVVSARFSPDGSRVVVASKDGSASIWSIDGTTLRFLGHDSHSRRALLRHRGGRELAELWDEPARLWIDPRTFWWRTGSYCVPEGERLERLHEPPELAEKNYARCRATIEHCRQGTFEDCARVVQRNYAPAW